MTDRIVTEDETWVHHVTPESKQQSMAWCEPPVQVRQKRTKSVVWTIFWDAKSILFIQYMPSGFTITADTYCKILCELCEALRRKGPGLCGEQVFFLHVNACPHTAAQTNALLQKFKWSVFNHPAYSPDLAPSDFFFISAVETSS